MGKVSKNKKVLTKKIILKTIKWFGKLSCTDEASNFESFYALCILKP